MEKKQSSVEQKVFKSSLDLLLYYLPSAIRGQFKEQIKQAKAMHKEEVQDAWLNGMKGEMIAPFGMNRYKPEAEEYYNETFGGTTGVIVFDNIHLTNTSGTNHLSHINPLTDKLTNGGNDE